MERSTFSVAFRIREKRINAKGHVPIFMRITVKKERAELSIHRTIDLKEWDSKIQGPSNKAKDAEELNDYLQQCRSRVYQFKKSLEYEDLDVTALSLKNRYLGLD